MTGCTTGCKIYDIVINDMSNGRDDDNQQNEVGEKISE